MNKNSASQDKKRIKRLILIILPSAFFVLLIAVLCRNVSSDISDQSLAAIKTAVVDSVIQCYSVEGCYPSDIKYLEDNYGLVINHNKYIVAYESFSDNILPEITVLVKGQETDGFKK